MIAKAGGELANKRIAWTDEQWEAISDRGHNLLVSAAAGAGKTSVLVQRVVNCVIRRDQPVDIDKLLVVTFTDAAAAEMRERIAAALDDLVARNPGSAGARLARQLALVGKADISTVHSFCHKVVRQHFYRLDIDPSFRVIDEVEAALMRLEVVDDLFEELYADGGGGEFVDLVDAYGGGRGDDAVRNLVIRLYDLSRGQPRPDRWFDGLAEAFRIRPGARVDGLPWTAAVIESIGRNLDRARRLLCDALELASTTGGPSGYAGRLGEEMEACSSMLASARKGEYAHLYDMMKGLRFDKMPAVRAGSCDDSLRIKAKSLRDEAKKLISAVKDMYFTRPPEDLIDDLRKVAPLIEELVKVVKAFAARYAEAKRARGLADFSDLEHLCLQVLATWDEGAGQPRPSDIARGLAARYEEILVDEYQDINPVQDAIISLVSRGDNTFVVGDVKQSIYGFRLAKPRLFAEKYRAYSRAASGSARKIDLSKNFRSRRAIVDAVNLVFRQLFSEDFSGIAYDRSAELAYGADFPDDGDGGGVVGDRPVELHIIDGKIGAACGRAVGASSSSQGASGSSRGAAVDSPSRGLPSPGRNGGDEGIHRSVEEEAETSTMETEAPDANQETDEYAGDGEPTPEETEALRLEGRLIARRITEMVYGSPKSHGPELKVWDKRVKAYRPVSYRDIVVLMRTTRHRANLLLEELRQAGVPAYAELGTGYFDATEIEVMLSLLRVIDNPMQDIPLAAVLLSPMCGFRADDLARVRMCRPNGPFYFALEEASGLRTPDRECGQRADEEGGARASRCPEDLAKRISAFLESLDSWRALARRVPLSSLIWQLYRETQYLDYVGGMPGGAQRQANLRALHERARQFDRFARQGLFRFLRFIDRLRDAEGDLGTARALGEAEDVVRIMSIHKSKGLEFPVVFVADLGKAFNLTDANGDVLIHAGEGLGPVYYDANRRAKCPTLAYRAIRERVKRDALAEEMRVLYVAMTRAKERLVLVGSASDLSKQASRWCEGVAGPERLLAEDVVVAAKGFLDWVASAIARHKDGKAIRELAGVTREPACSDVRDDQARFLVSMWSAEELARSAQTSGRLGIAQDKDVLCDAAAANRLGRAIAPEFRQAIEQHIGWKYRHAELATRAAKATWSEAKRESQLDEDEAEPLIPRVRAAQEGRMPISLVEQPRFMQEFRITPAERGHAMHLVLQHLDLGGPLDASAIRASVSGMVARDLLSRDLAATVRADAIERFFASSIGKRVIQQRERVKREIPFYLGIDVRDLDAGGVGHVVASDAGTNERVVVQGIIDCLVDEGDGFVLIDFKTGPTRQTDLEEAVRAYAGQIQVYTAAVEAVHGRPVKEAYLYFLETGTAVPMGPRPSPRLVR